MPCVNKMLTANEYVVSFTRPTWWSGFWTYVWVVIFLMPTFGISLLFLIPIIVHNKTTEFAITNKRVVFKSGLIRRNIEELRFDKIESVIVDQSITGRILGYSTVSVIGTGGTKLVAKGCVGGNEFRQKIYDNQDT